MIDHRSYMIYRSEWYSISDQTPTGLPDWPGTPQPSTGPCISSGGLLINVFSRCFTLSGNRVFCRFLGFFGFFWGKNWAPVEGKITVRGFLGSNTDLNPIFWGKIIEKGCQIGSLNRGKRKRCGSLGFWGFFGVKWSISWGFWVFWVPKWVYD